MEVERGELLRLFNRLKPGLASKEIVQEMAHFIFTGNTVLTYNDEVCVTYPFETDFQCSVSAKKLVDGLKKSKDNQVDLTMVKGELQLTSKDQKVGILTSTDKTVQEMAEKMLKGTRKGTWKEIPKDLTEGMFLCMFSCSRDETAGGLMGVYVSGDSIYSCDRLRATKYILESSVYKPFLIRGNIVKDMRQYTFSEYMVGDNWAHFKTDQDVIFSAKLFGDEYPHEKIETFLNIKGTKITLPQGPLQQAASDLITWTEGEVEYHKTIELSIRKGQITCYGKDDVGWMEKIVAYEEYNGEDLTLLISPVFLSEILNRGVTSMVVEDTMVCFRKSNFIHSMTLQSD